MAMFWFLVAAILAAALAAAVFFLKKCRAEVQRLAEQSDRLSVEKMQAVDAQREANQQLKQKAEGIIAQLKQRLTRYQAISDAEAEASRIRREVLGEKEEATRLLDAAKEAKGKADAMAESIIAEGKVEAEALKRQSIVILERANGRAAAVLENADKEAGQRSETALAIMQDTDKYRRALQALKNQVEGYGAEYIKPIQSVIDELADETAYKQAGQELKSARRLSKKMVQDGLAANCDYAEKNRKETATRFVVDAFNGKVDSILTTVKSTNVGKVEQKVRDAFALVNLNGAAFRNARITDAYLSARLEEVKWAALAQDVKKEQQEEQRRIREEIREEKKVKRELEKALKTAEREKMLIEKARAEMQQAILKATEAERVTLESQLAEMEEKLRIAEEQGQRALSMAQQTKRGNVYVISNIGSFGEGVFKIGLTRRLDPLDRVKELGDSSVPFGFDVHAMIEAEDAPALEHMLHKHFVLHQVNKVNHRKEFFRCDLRHIKSEVESLGLEATWTMAAEAQEFRETIAIESRIKEDPDARDLWMKRQFKLEDAEDTVELGADDDDDE